jgi:hypothetical protein
LDDRDVMHSDRQSREVALAGTGDGGVCIAGSLAAVWLVSLATRFTMNVRLVVVLSAVLSSAAIALEIRG